MGHMQNFVMKWVMLVDVDELGRWPVSVLSDSRVTPARSGLLEENAGVLVLLVWPGQSQSMPTAMDGSPLPPPYSVNSTDPGRTVSEFRPRW